MANQQYAAPSMEVVKFGHEDIVCAISGWTPNGKPGNGFGVVEEDKDHPFTDGDF